VDLGKSDPTERVLFQKEYGFSRPMADGSPADLARAMSLSTRDFTGEAIAGIHRAVRKAVASGVPAGS
jgi:hypothetical protein